MIQLYDVYKKTLCIKVRKGAERGGPWVAQSVEHLIRNFDSGHDLRVLRPSPALGSALSMESP